MANSAPPQNYDNHQKFVPAFHYVATPLLLVYVIYSVYVVVTAFSLDSVMGLLLATAVMMVALLARTFVTGPMAPPSESRTITPGSSRPSRRARSRLATTNFA